MGSVLAVVNFQHAAIDGFVVEGVDEDLVIIVDIDVLNSNSGVVEDNGWQSVVVEETGVIQTDEQVVLVSFGRDRLESLHRLDILDKNLVVTVWDEGDVIIAPC